MGEIFTLVTVAGLTWNMVPLMKLTRRSPSSLMVSTVPVTPMN